MGRQNIYQTTSVSSVMPIKMTQDLFDFLITNRSSILSPEKKSEAFKSRYSNHSLLSDVVHRMTMLGKDQAYSLIRFPTKTVALREAVDMTFIPIDLLQMQDLVSYSPKTLSMLPELNDKLIINITDITKVNGDFSDITQFYYRVLRDFLSRSFYVSSGNIWLSPTLVRYVAKVYSMTMGGRVARLFGLSPLLQTFVQTVFCAYFVGMMTSTDVATQFMKSHSRYLGLPDSTGLTDMLAFIQDTIGKPVPTSIEEVCQVIDAHDHGQMKSSTGSRLNRPILNHSVQSLFPEGHVSIISLEYPPYFVFMIMLVLSNMRIGLSFPMKNMNLIKEGQEVFEQLIRSQMFFNDL